MPTCCTPDDAIEVLRLLLRAASAGTVPRHVHFALGELHYHWGELLEFGKRAELGAEVGFVSCAPADTYARTLPERPRIPTASTCGAPKQLIWSQKLEAKTPNPAQPATGGRLIQRVPATSLNPLRPNRTKRNLLFKPCTVGGREGGRGRDQGAAEAGYEEAPARARFFLRVNRATCREGGGASAWCRRRRGQRASALRRWWCWWRWRR